MDSSPTHLCHISHALSHVPHATSIYYIFHYMYYTVHVIGHMTLIPLRWWQ